MSDVEKAMARLVHSLLPHEQVHINVLNEAHRRHVEAVLHLSANLASRVHFHPIPTNDAWIRDHGAIIVLERHPEGWKRKALNWSYNAWGGKYPPWDLDNQVPCHMARILGIPCEDAPLVLEGGAIEGNGEGLLLTTSCLLEPHRNPGHTRESIAAILQQQMGVRDVLWLEGELTGDDTDGHIDQLVRFVDASTVVVAVEHDPTAPHYPSLQEMHRQIELYARKYGLEVIDLPLPEAIYIRDQRMPASYANFYIANQTVVVPTFGVPEDIRTLELFQRVFPSRKVVGIDCREVIWGLGAIHCLTQQIPALPVTN